MRSDVQTPITPRPIHSVEGSQELFNRHSSSSNSQHSPQPTVAEFLSLWPERILFFAELLKLAEFGRVRFRVAARLGALFFFGAAEVAQEDVVRERT